jgi:uncharacterized repeat protein (TIGR03803 family)
MLSKVNPPSFGYRVLHDFGRKSDGYFPTGRLTDVSGTLYGTTRYGGYGNNGTVFSLSPSGREKVVYSFRKASEDGAKPVAALIDVGGVLYGTTSLGGTHNFGTVFSLTTAGKETPLYSFAGGVDGATPMSELTYFDKKLYGTTYGGGQYGGGTVFSVSTTGTDETVIHAFGQGNDGIKPIGGLAALNGKLYGTTSAGGGLSQTGFGTIFTISRSGVERVPFVFNCGDGAQPEARMIVVAGTLYGTASSGGTAQCTSGGNGVVFSYSTGESEQPLYPFGNAPDGNAPIATLLFVSQSSKLFGTAAKAGYFGGGAIFSVTLAGKETVLHSFGYGADGNTPQGGLARLDGIFFGTTAKGGKYAGGVAYALNP